MAAVEPERIFQIVQPFARRLVTAVGQPAIGLQQRCRAQIALRIPPVTRAGGGAAGTQNTLVKPVQFGAVFRGLNPFFLRCRCLGLQIGFDGRILGIEIGQVRHQVFHHRLMRQRIDIHRARNIGNCLGTGQRIAARDIHRARATYPFAAGAAEGQRRIDLVLDLDQRVQNHRPAAFQIDGIGIDPRVIPGIGIIAIDFEFL